jgi:hypothetical protein
MGGMAREGFFGWFSRAKGCGRNGINSQAGWVSAGGVERMKDEGRRMKYAGGQKWPGRRLRSLYIYDN